MKFHRRRTKQQTIEPYEVTSTSGRLVARISANGVEIEEVA